MKTFGARVPRSILTLVIICAGSLVIVSALNHSPSRSAKILDDCDCTAPDGSCSASISCKGGCLRFCGNNGDCYAECTDNSPEEFSIEMHNATYPKLVAELSRIGHKKLEFNPKEPNALLNVGFRRAVLWDALEYLSDRGTLRVDGKDFESLRKLRRVLLAGGRTNFNVTNVPVDTFVSDLAFVTGLPLHIVSGKPDRLLNLDLRNATLREILKKASEQTGIKISEVRT